MNITKKFCLPRTCHLYYLFICPCQNYILERLKYFLFLHNCIILPCSHHDSTLLCLPHLSLSSYLLVQEEQWGHPRPRPRWLRSFALSVSSCLIFSILCSSQNTGQEYSDFLPHCLFVIYSAALQAVCQTELKPF